MRFEVHVGPGPETPVALDELAAENEDVLPARPVVINLRPLRSGIHFDDPKPQTVATLKSAPSTTRANHGQRDVINAEKDQAQGLKHDCLHEMDVCLK
jgi:hypothetical protein